MLTWPWILVAIAQSRGGLVASPGIAAFVKANPQSVTFLATLTGTLFSVIATALFSSAIVRFSQSWIARRQKIDIYHISMLMTIRYKLFPWGSNDVPMVCKWYLIAVVAACILSSYLISSRLSTLLTPAKTESLSGTELDFTSNSPICFATSTFNASEKRWCSQDNFIDLNQTSHRGFQYSTCSAESSLVDAGLDGVRHFPQSMIFVIESDNGIADSFFHQQDSYPQLPSSRRSRWVAFLGTHAGRVAIGCTWITRP